MKNIFNHYIHTLVDTYSAVSANIFLHSMMATGLPLAAKPAFYGLGVGPAMSIFGGICDCLDLRSFSLHEIWKGLEAEAKIRDTINFYECVLPSFLCEFEEA